MSRKPLNEMYPWAWNFCRQIGGIDPCEQNLALLTWFKEAAEKIDGLSARLSRVEAALVKAETEKMLVEELPTVPMPAIIFPGLFARLREYRKSFVWR